MLFSERGVELGIKIVYIFIFFVIFEGLVSFLGCFYFVIGGMNVFYDLLVL